MIILDIIVAVILFIGIIQGWKEGTLTSLLKLVGSILVFVIAFYLRGPVTSILVNYLPFLSFGGVFEGITSLNIILYEGLSFVICIIVLSIIFKLILKLSKSINKLLNSTIILGFPNKFIGSLINFLRYYVVCFILLFVASLIPYTSIYIKESRISNIIINNTPILSYVTKNFNDCVSDIYRLLKNIDSDKKITENDAEALEILLKYEIINTDTAKKLKDAGKLEIENFDEIVAKYEKNTENNENNQ